MAHESKPSKTALLVSQAVYFKSLDKRFNKYCVEETVTLAKILIEKFHPAKKLWIFLLHIPIFRRLAEIFESFILPGFMNHVLLRKWWINTTVRNLFTQPGCFINVGAGFDGLAWSLKNKGIAKSTYEMDFPQTQILKKSLLPIDIVQFLGLNWDELKDQVSKEEAPLVILLEGVSMYLSEMEVKDLLKKLASLNSKAPCFLVATAMEVDEKGIAHFYGSSNLLGTWLRHVSEPFAWGIAPDALPVLLQDCGWQIEKIVQTSEVARSLNLNVNSARGEYLFVARRNL